MHKHIKMLVSTVCFVIGLYAGDKARTIITNRSK